jgi:hypothetical protein
MEQKNRAVTMLLAAAAIVGLDRAIALLQNERTLVQHRIDEGRKLTLGDLFDAANGGPPLANGPVRRSRPSRSPARVAKALTEAALETVKFTPRPKRRTYKRPVPVSAKRPVHAAKKSVPAAAKPLTWNGNVTQWRKACKAAMAKGPQKLRIIVRTLQKAGIVRDVSPETKREVRKYLKGDKTFAIRTNDIYAIRSRA